MLLDTRLAAQTTQQAMGTIMVHKAFGEQAGDSLAAVCSEVMRMERLLSRFLPGSDISRINQSAGIKSEPVNPNTYAVLSKAAEFSKQFPGCFDVTIEPLVALWALSKASLNPPDEDSIQQTLALVNADDLILDPWEMSAGLRYSGQAIDLGGIGKGFTGDRLLEVFKAFGIPSACSNLGGNVVTLGTKPDGSSPWQVGIQHPRQENRLIGSVSVVGQSVVTSGDYQRYFIDRQGKRRHHILNPTTGYPAESGWVSVSVITETSLTADALSTLLFVAGKEKSLEYLSHFPAAEAVFIDADLQIFITQGLKNRFQADQGSKITIFS